MGSRLRDEILVSAKHARGRESGHVHKPGSMKEDAPPAPSTYFWECTTLRSSGEDSLCPKETGTHFDKKKAVLTVFRTMAKVNNQPL